MLGMHHSATDQPPDMEFPRGGGGGESLEEEEFKPPHESLEEDFEPPHELDVEHFHKVNSLIRDENVDELLKIILNGELQEEVKQIIPQKKKKPVNLMKDPLLSVVIAAMKTGLAVKLIEQVPDKELTESNCNEDTPLHTAAAEGDIAVAEALLGRNKDLVELVNSKGETPLHTAAIHGNESMFWCLVHKGNMEEAPHVRRDDGSTVLHCAITANAPKLALDIARRFPLQITSRNSLAATPLQVMVTIPNFFESQLVHGPLESFLYHWIVPWPEDFQSKDAAADEETGRSVHVAPTDDDGDVQAYGWKWQSVRSKFPSQYTTILDLLELTGSWLRHGIFKFLKLFYETVKTLEEHKKRHKEALQLVQHLAHSEFYDFYCMGYSGSNASETSRYANRSPSTLSDRQSQEITLDEIRKMLFKLLDEGKEKVHIRWNEPPLVTGAKLGLHDFVREILQVCPQSATYLESNGKNVLQVAIESGRKEVVSVLSEMLEGSNPILPSWLCSIIDAKSTRNTILHLAAENSPVEEGDAVQLQHELEWFEMVEKLVPRELVNSRNKEEKTAHELFTERHEKTLKNCKTQLVEMGKMCAGLVAAVVFTSSFSIPGDKDNGSNEPLHFHNFFFKIFSHSYVIGFGCAATALVLFLSLVITPYKQRDFRRAIPMQFFLACLSFALSLAAFLLSFVCSFILQIYGGKLNTKRLISLLLELVLLPVICFAALLYQGAKFGPSFSRLWK